MSNIETMINEVENLDDEIFKLNQTIAPDLAKLTDARNNVKGKLDFEIAKSVTDELGTKDYGCGTATIELPQHKIKVVVSKKVKWDEGVLRNVADQIKSAGQNPEAFIKYKLSVSETSYKGFPEDIQKVFEPARSVEPNAPKISIERK